MADGQIPHIAPVFKDVIRPDDARLAAQKRLKAKQALLELQASEAARSNQAGNGGAA